MQLLDTVISERADAPVILLFGGSPYRRHQVITLLLEVGDLTVHGALSEEEGITLIRQLPRLDLVLIGGAYGLEERGRIRNFLSENSPEVKITEPGAKYTYSDENIKNDVRTKLGLDKISK